MDMEIQSPDQGESQDSGTDLNSTQNIEETSTEGQELGDNIGNLDPNSPPAYMPNFKFKVHDQEHEIPEFLRGVVKDAETEKQLKEIYEKAYGLDHIKPKHTELKTKYETTAQKLNHYESSIQEMAEAYQRDDLGSVFKHLNIPFEKVLKYVSTELNYNELPPEQRQALDSYRETQRKAVELEKQLKAQQSEYSTYATQVRERELDTRLGSPEVKPVVEEFDSLYGKGSFLQEVIARGKLAYYESKKDISVDEAVDQVLHFFKGPKQVGSQQTPPAPALTAGQPAAQPAKKEVPVIPHVGGSASSSPVKQKPRSLEDLKQIRNQMTSR